MSEELPQADPNAPLRGAAATVDRQALVAIIWTCFSIASCFLTLRLVVRWRQNARFLSDDYWMIWAWMCMLTMAILQTEQMNALFYMTHLQAGRILAQPEEILVQNQQLTRWQFPIIKLFWITLWSVKASFMSIFYRLIRSFPVLRRLWYCVAAFAVLALIGCVLASTLTCSPPSDYFTGKWEKIMYSWSPRLITDFLTGNCNSPHEVWMQSFNVIYSTSVDIATDLMIMALPIAALPSLQLDTRRKVALGAVFAIGVIIICVAVVRMTQVIVGDSVDLVGLAIWGAVESATAIIVGSLPPLKSLLTRGVKKYQSTKKSSGNKYGDDGTGQRGNTKDRYGHNSSARAVMASESIPLDHMHESGHQNGGIYVQKTFASNIESDRWSSGEDDERHIVNERTRQ